MAPQPAGDPEPARPTAAATVEATPSPSGTPSSPDSAGITAITETSQNGEELAVSWSAAGNSPTGYDVLIDGNPGTGCANDLASPCTVTGLTPGQTYQVVVRANYNVDPSVDSATWYATPNNVPGGLTPPLAPTLDNPVLVNGTNFTLDWNEPGNGGAQILGSTVTVSRTGGSGEQTTVSCVPVGPTDSTCDGVGEVGTQYEASVTTWNSQGASQSSNTVPFQIAGPPGAPAFGQTGTGDRSVTVEWTAPQSDGGAPITKYTATLYTQADQDTPIGTGCEVNVGPQTPLTCVFDSPNHQLTNGTAYVVTVTATNSVGAGAAATSPALTPDVVPDAPTIGTPTPGDRSITVPWTAPTPNGGSPVTAYHATVREASASPSQLIGADCVMTPPAPLTCTFGAPGYALTNGTDYVVTVWAVNDKGEGTPTTSGNIMPVGAPDAPAVQADATGTAITVSWTLSEDGGAAVTAYHPTLTEQNSNPAVTVPCAMAQATSTTCSATGLPGRTYDVSVTAENSKGTSTAGTATVSTGSTVPGTPTNVSAALNAATNVITVGWSAPASNGGASISGYTTTVTRQQGGPGADTLTCSPPENGVVPTSCTATGVPGATYDIAVKAVNTNGPSATAGTTTRAVPAIAAPTNVTITPGDATATVNWTAVPANSAVTGYTLTVSPTVGTVTVGAGITTKELMGLTNGTTYSVIVKATVAAGTVMDSGGIKVTPSAPPEVPATEPATSNGTLTAPAGATTPEPGEEITVTGTGFAANSVVRVVLFSTPIDLGTALTNQAGTFSKAVTIPAGVSGSHTITSIGLGTNGLLRVLKLDVTVADASDGSDGGSGLAVTGTPIGAIALLGVLLIVAGAAGRMAARRRRSQT